MPRAPDLAGRALDERYEIHEMLGEGTFGRVYRGADRRLERAVAVKVIKPWWAEDSDWVERFHREAQLLARVNDPGVVQIFDIGHAEEGPYYVAELVEGMSLAERLQSGPLEHEQARAVAERVCRALAGAHRQGVMHCDVKPANVLLGDDSSVKVGDFGVARLAEGSSQEPSATVAGTPRYMAPEQARGLPATAATDIYSVGIVLYEMLTGAPPFQSGSAVELALCHLQDPPPPLPSSVPSRLRAVVRRALAKDPAERFGDCAEMAEALHEAALGGASTRTPVRSPRPGKAASPALAAAGGSGSRGFSTAATAIVGAAAPVTRATVGERAAGGADVDGAAVDEASATVIRARPLSAERDEAAATVARTRPFSGARKPPPAPPAPPAGGPKRRRGFILSLAVLPVLAVALGALALVGQHARTTVPELRGLPLGGVVARARRLHVRPSFSRRHSQAAKGTAISQSPAPGTRVASGSTVDVVLSAGPPAVSVPGVVGEPASTAESEVTQAGLRYDPRTVPAPESEPGVVVRQSPDPASSAPRGSTVTLSISETPRWRSLTTFSGIDDGRSVAVRILGRRWRVSYSMDFRGTCVFLVVCGGPHAQVVDVESGASAGGFDLEEGESHSHIVDSGPGMYRLEVAGGRDSASWTMTVEDLY